MRRFVVLPGGPRRVHHASDRESHQ
jgi:hypothetical protein